ncbi:Chaperone protein DnaJ [Nitrosopumilaceae archaeon]|nr:Chaperone protein DnaJ [Nitrosopumilaceae archaeon]
MTMSAKRDYYEVLGVEKSSPADEIKRQYRKMALKFHPDRNKSAEAAEHFKEVSEAYAVLSDPEKRQVYDVHGHAGVDGRYSPDDISRGAQQGFGDAFGGMGGFGNIFDSIFGGRGGGVQRGSDLMYQVGVTLEEVLNGKRIELDLQKQVSCGTCGGNGCRPGTGPKRCGTCGGQGQVRQERRMGNASFITAMPCPGCRGRGSVIEEACSGCGGRGFKKGTKKVEFDLPPGIDSGDYTLQGGGDEVPGGVNGDLVVRVSVLKHEKFNRDGRDIYYDHEVTMVDAALGGSATVPTLEGTERIKIEQGSQPNTLIRLKGKGVPQARSRGRGDQYVRLVVHIPKKLSKRQKQILSEFERDEK